MRARLDTGCASLGSGGWPGRDEPTRLGVGFLVVRKT